MIDATIRLRDGRVLAYAEYGVPHGVPVLYFHGTLGSRFEGTLIEAAATRQGIRLITTDRPGHGRSSPQENSTFASWAEDVRELADALGLKQFGVMGLSGGGSHAACVAAVLKGRISRLSLVSANGPPDLDGVASARAFGVRVGVGLMDRTMVHMELFASLLSLLVRVWGERLFLGFAWVAVSGDKRALRTKEVRRGFTAAWTEGTRQGSRGAALDIRLQSLPWDVQPTPPGCPVDLWYGLDDRITPVELGRHFAEIYPGATLRELPDEGHLLISRYGDEIFSRFHEEQARVSA